MKNFKFPFFSNNKIFTVTAIILLITVILFSFIPKISALGTATVTITHSGNGKVVCATQTPPFPTQVNEGTFTFTEGTSLYFVAQSDANYIFAGFFISVNGVPTAESYSNPLTFSVTTTAFTISAHFIPSTVQTYRILISNDVHTFMNPAIDYNVNAGSGTTVYYNSVLGYQITSVRVDGSNVPIVGYYSWSNIQANHAINVQSTPISQSNIMLSFSNNSGGGISWEDLGLSTNPLPPLNPIMGGHGTFGFPVGERIQVHALPDSQNGYVFGNIEVNNGTDTTVITEPIYNLVVSEGLTITANFDYIPATTYTVIVSSIGNGQLTWYDSTTDVSGGEGTQTFNVGDSVNFTSYAYEGSFRHGIFSTWGLLNGMTNDFQVNLVINTDFNITAVFTNSNANYSISLFVQPNPLNYDLSTNTTNFILEQGIDYTVSVYFTSDNTNSMFGTYNISSTGLGFSKDIADDVGVSWLNNWAWAKYNTIQPAYSAGGSYHNVILNENYFNGNFQFIITSNGTYGSTLYQGLIISLYDEMKNFNVASPIYTFTWQIPNQVSTSPTPTPTNNNGGNNNINDATSIFTDIFGNIKTDIVFVIFGIICGLATWKFALTGLIAGIGISTLLCAMANLMPIWGIGLCIVLDITIIVLGSGLLSKRSEATS